MHFYTIERNVQMLIYLLKQHGVKKIVASPGTTNMTFVYSVQQDGFFEIYSAADERSAAYLACGLAVESGEMVALSCTGATASRNYMPGLTEAFYRKIPILAITSTQHRGRYGNQIPQFVDRSTLPKDIAKMSVYIPTIHSIEDEWQAEVNINKAILELHHNGEGPVHINLETEYCRDYTVKELPKTRVIKRINSKQIFPEITEDIKKIAVFVGAHKVWDQELTRAVDEFCETYNAVVLCDQTSNYRGKYGIYATLITYQENGSQEYKVFDLMIHIGEVSGAYMGVEAKQVWRVAEDGELCDTFRTLSYVFEMEEITFFGSYRCASKSSGISKTYQIYKQEYRRLYSLIPELPFSNLWVAKELSSRLPDNGVLHLGILNSLRSWNFFEINQSVLGYSNTGGFGIDGSLSSLIGAAMVNPKKIYFGVVGDLAFFYDMNVLGNRHLCPNIRIILITNGCGAEFKLYNHLAYQLGQHADDYIASKGHYGNKSVELVKHYVEDLGFTYICAHNKQEFAKGIKDFLKTEVNKPILYEIFTVPENESLALERVCRLNGIREEQSKNVIQETIEVPKRYQTLDKKTKYVLWGAGACFHRHLMEIMGKCDIAYVCDNDVEKWGKEITAGVICISPDELKSIDNIFVIITLESATLTMQVANQLLDMGIEHFDSVYNWLRY